ncbi:MAG TPA: preprotein translocase subunit SecG [Paracoccus sp. (in: a-proteobacteria)]|uniref:preprotein translocase subunit SecG n=1 Tax=uncultured Paracoccus sp. TaxID=189685 RepID=UPI00263762CC|nr:preprotein translocase subunit SecG [uncultured Paracoccus sp.]HMQ42418.1 preprotein translocase subunit SecG [Paracoccus sp. (in: a-proteobacteria)]HMR37354.1 preprotein translocase subunit SecG [Paracoccus sp. (in: a-proteobacteria)]
MENVVLTVHLILALLLIGIVLLQRSEGGGLGMGGGGGAGGGVMTGRQAANALSKMTWIIAAAFLATSITLAVLASNSADGGSVLDQLGVSTGGSDSGQTDSGAPALPSYTPPPGAGEPIAPPAPEAAAPAAAEAAAPAADAPADSPVAPPAAN